MQSNLLKVIVKKTIFMGLLLQSSNPFVVLYGADKFEYVEDAATIMRAARETQKLTSSAIVGPGGCDLTQVLDVLVAIKNRIGCVTDDVCCNTILGILGNACEILGPDSSISSILLEILNEINGTQTVICTFTQIERLEQEIEDLSEQLTECCDNLATGINDIQEALCAPIMLHQSDFGSSTFIIDTPGKYVFAEDITFSPAALNEVAIEIRSNDVTLDLCGKTLQQGNGFVGTNGIRVQGGSVGSPRSNVEVRNGTIQNFTRAGISVGTNTITPTNNACVRIRLQNLDVVACHTRGIEFLGSALHQITESEINDCNIINCCTAVSADFAFDLLHCSSLFVSKCSLHNNGFFSTNLTVVNVQECSGCSFSRIDIDNSRVESFVGFLINLSESCVFTQCTISECIAGQTLRGFLFNSGGANQQHIVRLCTVNNNQSGDLFVGYDLSEDVTRNQLVECLAANNTTTGSSATANCYGFNYDRVMQCSTLQCRALNNITLGDGTTNIAAGFHIGSNVLIGGCTGCEWVRCSAVGNTGIDALRSFGFRAASVILGNDVNAYIGNIAYRNGPLGTAISTRQITADAGVDGFTGGVPLGSVVTVASLGALNGVSDAYSNIRIGD